MTWQKPTLIVGRWYKLTHCGSFHWIWGSSSEHYSACGKTNLPIGIPPHSYLTNPKNKRLCKKCLKNRFNDIKKL